MRHVVHWIGRQLERPRVRFVVAMGLLATCLFEIFETGLEELVGFEIGAHHGVAMLAFSQGTRALHEVLEGAKAALEVAEVSVLVGTTRTGSEHRRPQAGDVVVSPEGVVEADVVAVNDAVDVREAVVAQQVADAQQAAVARNAVVARKGA